MARNIATAVFAFSLVCIFTASGSGQDRLLDELYGRGVHHFFARDYAAAHKMLSMAVDQGSQDPRVYYYRGLTFQNLGRPEEAETDFQRGAELEVANIVPVSVSRALERVQGSIRLSIETHRQDARISARMETLARDRARYEQQQDNEQKVLRDPNAPVPANDPVLPEAKQPTEDDPFSDIGGASGGPPAATPAAPTAPANSDPFGGFDTPASPANPANEDPFGAPAPAPAPGPAMPAGGVDDPFTDDNAVGPAGAAVPPPAAAPPAAAPPAADGGDIFGGGDDPLGAPAPPAAAPPAAAPPAAAPPAAAPPADEPADDPFGAGAPAMDDADAPADDGADPFADDDPFAT